MSTEREMTRVVRSWLRTDEHESADRILDIVLDRLDTTPQRRSWWPTRRFADMNTYAKLGIAAAAIGAIAVVSINVLPNTVGPGGPAVAPTPEPSVSASPGPSPGAAIHGIELAPPGSAWRASTFSEPFTFTLPAFPSDSTTPVLVEEVTSGRIQGGPSRGVAFVSSLWGNVSFHDDVSLPADMCRPTGERIDDIPATLADVSRWLTSGAGLEVDEPSELTVDGRTAMVWDVTTPSGVCDETADEPPPWFGAGERHRIYAIPTEGDTILAITWGANWGEGTEAYLDDVNAAADDLVSSMTFGD